MSRVDDTLASVASFVSRLGRGGATAPPSTHQRGHKARKSSTASFDLHRCKLAGPKSGAKDALEAELSALSQRIQYLEMQAESASRTFPDTPNESSAPPSMFIKAEDAHSQNVTLSQMDSGPLPNRNPSVSSRSVRLNNLLAARESRNGDADHGRTVSEDDIDYLREHVQKQSEEIKSQRDMIAEISKGLVESHEQNRLALHKVETEDVGLLERELRKHQQANEAFQKALREIGGIITQVANGDLSMRVQTQASEMDQEIATFKRTINKMMDQLEIFGSEVSRVAKEVGTDGILGGQAKIPDVHGVWKELTDNGKSSVCIFCVY